VLVDGERVITDSDEAISYLEEKYDADLEKLELHRRELSPTVYGTLSLGVDEATEKMREALEESSIEVLEELDLSSCTGGEGPYILLLAVDPEFMRLAAEANAGSATLAMLKIAVYEEDGSTRVQAIEPEKGAGQIRDPEVNDRGLELRKRFIRAVKDLESSPTIRPQAVTPTGPA